MALPFFNNVAKKRDQMIAVDLGSRTTKAVNIQRRGDGFALCGYVLLDAPIFEKTLSPEMLAEHLKQVNAGLQGKTRVCALSLGVTDTIVRTIDLPNLPPEDMRVILRMNSRNYLQQDMSNYLFDCHVLKNQNSLQGGKPAATGQKQRVLVAGARKQLVQDHLEGGKSAGFVVDQIVPGLICPVNAFEKAMPDIFATEVVALIDIGFRNTSICIVSKGELALSRVVNIGGDRFTSGISDAMKISYAEAEGIKIGMPAEVQPHIEYNLVPLARELRASIDFFEHQADTTVNRAFISGGSARSPSIIQSLQTEIMMTCAPWSAATSLQLQLPPQQAADLEDLAPQFVAAVGAALGAM